MSNPTAAKKSPPRILWLAIVVCLLPFLLLPFLNNMAADDFVYCNMYRVYGFWGTQGFVYHNWAGRYTTNFLNALFEYPDLLRHYYWLPCLLLFACTGGAIFFLLSSLQSLLPQRIFSRGQLIQLSFLFFILFLYVQAEIATSFYWFSSAIVYQPSFILSLLFFGSLARRLGMAGGAAPVQDAFLLVLILLIIGCNEMAAVFILLFLAGLTGFYYYHRRPVPGYCWLYLAVAFAMCCVVVFSSGVITQRRRLMNAHTSYLNVLAIACFQFVSLLFSIFKEPLFWFAVAVLFLFGVQLSPCVEGKGIPGALRQKKLWVPGLIFLLAIAFLSLLTVLVGSRGSLPPRALNNLTGWTTGGMLLLGFLAGLSGGLPAGSAAGLPASLTGGLPAALLVVLLLASTNYRDAWKTVLSGYFYHAVFVDRDRQLSQAVDRHHPVVVTLSTYPVAVEEKISQVFPHGIFETMHTLLLEKPPLMYIDDGAAAQHSAYWVYYGVDSILIKK